ncbi:MAG: hypothetical protein HYX48_06065 [Chlamydiales bacterium]|nr:hypothetical protein [Chlamydiales bacterium]
MTSTSLTTSQRLNEEFYSWTRLVTEYASSDKPAEVSELIRSHFQTRRAAQAYISSLTERTPPRDGSPYPRAGVFKIPVSMFSSPYRGRGDSFYPIVHEALTEMALVPEERALIRAVASEADKRKAQVVFEKAVTDPFEQMFAKMGSKLLGGFGKEAAHESCAQAGIKELSHFERYIGAAEEIHTVTLDIDRTFFTLMEDGKGERHLEKLSLRRTLAHELVHVFHALTRRYEAFEKLPKTVRWTNGHEEAAIAGTCEGAVFEFSENAFARARGEMQRLTHQGWWLGDSREALFLQALQVGAYGTMHTLMLEWLKRKVSRDFCEERVAQTKKVGAALEQVFQVLPKDLVAKSFAGVTAAVEKQMQGVQEDLGVSKLFDLDRVLDEYIIKARTMLPVEMPAQTNKLDEAFFDELVKHRHVAYGVLIEFFKNNGREKRVEVIEREIGKIQKEREDFHQRLIKAGEPLFRMQAELQAQIAKDNAERAESKKQKAEGKKEGSS